MFPSEPKNPKATGKKLLHRKKRLSEEGWGGLTGPHPASCGVLHPLADAGGVDLALPPPRAVAAGCPRTDLKRLTKP